MDDVGQTHACGTINSSTLATIFESFEQDDQFSALDLSILKRFFDVCSAAIVNHNKEKEHETFFAVARSSGIDLSLYHKEGGFIQALWVIYLGSLKCILEETEYKYQTLENFLTSYAGAFDNVDNKEKVKLFHIANWMAIMFKLIPARKNKGLAINVVPKLVEGWRAKYVTGSGQKPATALRVLIFQTEGHVKPFHRGVHRLHDDDVATVGGGPLAGNNHTSGSESRGGGGGYIRVQTLLTSIADANGPSGVSSPVFASGGLKRGRGGSSYISGESNDDMERTIYNTKSKRILAISETIEAHDHKQDLEWEQHADLFKKTDFNILKHGNHGFNPINHDKEKKDTHQPKVHQVHHKKEKTDSSSSESLRFVSKDRVDPYMVTSSLSFPIAQPALQTSIITQLLLRDSTNNLNSGTLSRDVSAILKNDEISHALSLSFFGTNQGESFFDSMGLLSSSPRSGSGVWVAGQDLEWLDGIDSTATSPRTPRASSSISALNGIGGVGNGIGGVGCVGGGVGGALPQKSGTGNEGRGSMSAIDTLMQW